MKNVYSGKCVEGKGDSRGEEKPEEGPKVKNPHLAAGPFPALDIHDRSGDTEAKQKAYKGNKGLHVDGGHARSPPGCG